MAQKLPIAETAVDAGAFGVAALWPTLRVGWFAILLYVGAMIAAGVTIHGADPELFERLETAAVTFNASDPWGTFEDDAAAEAAVEEFVRGLGWRLPAAVGFVLLGALAFVPLFVLLLRHAAGVAPMPGGVFYWRWGSRELRFVLVWLLYALAFLVVSIALEWIALGPVTGLAERLTGGLLGVWETVISLGVTVVTLWVMVRTLFVPVAAAVEDDFSVGAALRATGGNAFRLIGSLLLLYLILILAVIGFSLVLLIVSLVLGLATSALGSETLLGSVLGMVMAAAAIGATILFVLGLNLTGIGWAGKAWGSLRPGDNTGSGDA